MRIPVEIGEKRKEGILYQIYSGQQSDKISKICWKLSESLGDKCLKEYCKLVEKYERLYIGVKSVTGHALTESTDVYIGWILWRIYNLTDYYCPDEIKQRFEDITKRLIRIYDINTRMIGIINSKEPQKIFTEASSILNDYQKIIDIVRSCKEDFQNGFASIKNKIDDKQVLKFGEDTLNYLKELLDIAENQLGFSKGDIPFNIQSLQEPINTAVDFITQRYKFKASTFEIKIKCDPDEFWFNRGLIERIAIEFLNNALLHAVPDKNTMIIISAQKIGNNIQLYISDNGKGIPAQLIASGRLPGRSKIFDLGFSTIEKGTGLGLCEAWWVIQSHGGTIDVVSELGKGTAFTITFPALNKQRVEKIVVSQRRNIEAGI